MLRTTLSRSHGLLRQVATVTSTSSPRIQAALLSTSSASAFRESRMAQIPFHDLQPVLNRKVDIIISGVTLDPDTIRLVRKRRPKVITMEGESSLSGGEQAKETEVSQSVGQVKDPSTETHSPSPSVDKSSDGQSLSGATKSRVRQTMEDLNNFPFLLLLFCGGLPGMWLFWRSEPEHRCLCGIAESATVTVKEMEQEIILKEETGSDTPVSVVAVTPFLPRADTTATPTLRPIWHYLPWISIKFLDLTQSFLVGIYTCTIQIWLPYYYVERVRMRELVRSLSVRMEEFEIKDGKREKATTVEWS